MFATVFCEIMKSNQRMKSNISESVCGVNSIVYQKAEERRKKAAKRQRKNGEKKKNGIIIGVWHGRKEIATINGGNNIASVK